MVSPLVSTQWLVEHLDDKDLVVADVRWRPGEPDWPYRAYMQQRVPGAVHLDLDRDLSDRSDLSRGRHPLPAPERFVESLARVGIGRGTRVVAYDDAAGGIAGRLWWMLHWIGAPDAAVLDGGLARWVGEGRPTESGEPIPPASATERMEPLPNAAMVADKRAVAESLASGGLVMDARAGERFRGEVEPIDKVAGHIAGAVHAAFSDNLTTDDAPVFRSVSALRERFERLGVQPGRDVISYCGSGVTACHNALAMMHAGLGMPRVYPGSWSEWSCDATCAVAKGA